MNIRDLSISIKLQFSVIFFLTLFCIYVSINTLATNKNNILLQEIKEVYLPVLEKIDYNVYQTENVKRSFEWAISIGDPEELNNAAKGADNVKESFNILKKTVKQNQEIENFEKAFVDYYTNTDLLIKDIFSKKIKLEESKEKIATLNDQYKNLSDQMKKYREVTYKNLTDSVEQAGSGLSRANIIGFLFGIVLVLLFIFLLFLIKKFLISQLNVMTSAVKNISEGRLNHHIEIIAKDEIGTIAEALNYMIDELQIKTKLASSIANGDLQKQITLKSNADELGVSLNNMTNNLKEAFLQIKNSANSLLQNSEQMIAANAGLASDTKKQSFVLEEFLNLIADFFEQSKKNAEQTQKADVIGSEIRTLITQGGNEIRAVVAAMNEIKQASDSIKQIIKVISEIAFQTNLLALNAAVEAARAGVHGKGFAVVAEEVRTLATRSAKAAEESTELITTTLSKSDNGITISHNASAVFNQIEEKISKIINIISEINNNEKSKSTKNKSIDVTSGGIQQTKELMKDTVAIAENTTQIATELRDQANSLNSIVNKFSLGETH